jgi:hypothetical protein
MPIRCFPIFGRATSKDRDENEVELDKEALQAPSKSPLSFMGLILRKDSALTAGSFRSNSSTMSSASTHRLSVSFNPKVEEVFFDKHEAPSHIRTLTPITGRRNSRRTQMPARSAPPLVFKAVPVSASLGSPSCKKLERRHMIADITCN